MNVIRISKPLVVVIEFVPVIGAVISFGLYPSE